ncbi:hypothetical protein TNCV_1663111 [Trichonephila clavipes]|nr:hypothetical protein TNCV_1663111 [Trichonephila clavipes]
MLPIAMATKETGAKGEDTPQMHIHITSLSNILAPQGKGSNSRKRMLSIKLGKEERPSKYQKEIGGC